MAGGGQGGGGFGGGAQPGGGMGGGQGGGGYSAQMVPPGAIGGDTNNPIYAGTPEGDAFMNRSGMGGFGGGYGGGMGGFDGGYGMGSPFGGFGMGMPMYGGFGMGMGSPFGGFGGMPMYGGYGGGMGGYGGFGGMPMYGGFGGGMGGFDGGMKGGFSRGMGSPFRGGMGGIQDRMYRGEPGMVYAGGSPDFYSNQRMAQTQSDPGGRYGVINPVGGMRRNINVAGGVRNDRGPALLPPEFQPPAPESTVQPAVQPEPEVLSGTMGGAGGDLGTASYLNKGTTKPYIIPGAAPQVPAKLPGLSGFNSLLQQLQQKPLTKPYIEPAAPAAPQVPTAPTMPEAPAIDSRGTVETKDAENKAFVPSGGYGTYRGQYEAPNPGNNPMGTRQLPRPTSAQEAYDQAMSYYNDPASIRYYESLAPSTRAFMDDPRDEARARYRAEQARANYTAFQGKDPWARRAGGIVSLLKRK